MVPRLGEDFKIPRNLRPSPAFLYFALYRGFRGGSFSSKSSQQHFPSRKKLTRSARSWSFSVYWYPGMLGPPFLIFAASVWSFIGCPCFILLGFYSYCNVGEVVPAV